MKPDSRKDGRCGFRHNFLLQSLFLLPIQTIALPLFVEDDG